MNEDVKYYYRVCVDFWVQCSYFLSNWSRILVTLVSLKKLKKKTHCKLIVVVSGTHLSNSKVDSWTGTFQFIVFFLISKNLFDECVVFVDVFSINHIKI